MRSLLFLRPTFLLPPGVRPWPRIDSRRRRKGISARVRADRIASSTSSALRRSPRGDAGPRADVVRSFRRSSLRDSLCNSLCQLTAIHFVRLPLLLTLMMTWHLTRHWDNTAHNKIPKCSSLLISILTTTSSPVPAEKETFPMEPNPGILNVFKEWMKCKPYR